MECEFKEINGYNEWNSRLLILVLNIPKLLHHGLSGQGRIP